MKRSAFSVLIFLAILGSVAIVPSLAQTRRDEAAIRKVLAEQTEAWNRGDLEGFMRGYWKSEKLKFVSRDKVTTGWQQTLDNYKKNYSSREAMGRLSFGDLEIYLLSKTSAFVIGSWRLDGPPNTPHGKFTLLWRKFKNGWRIVVDHSS
jgi:ketosteroid isomerase-like protein